MKYRFTFIFLFLSVSTLLYSQQWIWSRANQSDATTKVFKIAIDDNFNVYATGQVNGNTDIGAPSLLSMLGGGDFYLVKYDDGGNYLWHKQIAGSTGTDQVTRGMVTTDPSGNAIFAAFYTGNITNDIANIAASTDDTEDVLMVKYSADGSTRLWSRTVAWGKANIRSQHVTTDPSGNIYITGVSTEAVYFSATDSVYHVSGKALNFIAKYDTDGNFIQATKIGYSTSNIAKNKFVEIEAASESEVYIGGFFLDTVYAGSYTLYTANAASTDALLLKLDASGNVTWARKAGDPDNNDRCNGVSTDDAGSVYITGYIEGSAVFDSTAAMSEDSGPLVSAGSFDMMVAKYNPNGTLRWKRRNGDSGADIGYGAFISENLVMFSGYYSGTVTFNNATLSSGDISNNNTGFFVYDTDGNPITAQDITGDDRDRGESIEYDRDGKTYIGGEFNSSDLTIGDDVYNSGGTKDGFIAVYRNPFSATFSHTKNVSCNGGNDGELTATPYFGIGPYTYTWTGNVSTDSTAVDLTAGTYYVTITDSRDSTTIINAEITEANPINIGFTSTNLTCYQSADGAIDVTVTGGTVSGNYIYNWSGGTGLVPLDEDQSGLSASWYKLTVTDDNACQKIDSAQLIQPDKILFNTSVVSPAFGGGSQGSIDLNLTGGTPNFTYSWAREGVALPGRVYDTLNNLDGANYQITVTDVNSCVADTVFVVPDASLLQIDKYMTEPSCYDDSDGWAAVSVVVKDPAATYSYQWSTSGTDSSIVDVPAGKYYVTVTETGGLGRPPLEDSITVTQPDELVILSIVPTNVACYGESTGAVTLSVDGGTPEYSYEWSNGAETESISLLSADTYYVTVTDVNLCTVNTFTSVEQNDSIEIGFNLLQEITCYGYTNGNLQATVTGGAGGFSYQWDDPGEQTSSSVINLGAGTYNVEVTDIEGCSNSDSYTLTQPDSIEIAIVDTSNVSCYSSSDGGVEVNVTGGQQPYDYAWSPALPNSASVTNLPPFTYYLTVTDNTGICKNTSFSFAVKRPPSELSVSAINTVNNLCFGDEEGQIQLEATGGWGNYEYSVNGADYQASTQFSGLAANNYIGYARDVSGCTANMILPVEIEEPGELALNSYSVTGGTIRVFIGGGTPPYTFLLDNDIENTTGEFTNLSTGAHTIEVTDANGCGPLLIENINVITGIETFDRDKLTIYPNPSEGIFNLRFETNAMHEYRIQVYSVSGGLIIDEILPVYPGIENNLPLDMSACENGIYLLKINGEAIDQRLIVY
jgi:hypothetical protein